MQHSIQNEMMSVPLTMRQAFKLLTLSLPNDEFARAYINRNLARIDNATFHEAIAILESTLDVLAQYRDAQHAGDDLLMPGDFTPRH